MLRQQRALLGTLLLWPLLCVPGFALANTTDGQILFYDTSIATSTPAFYFSSSTSVLIVPSLNVANATITNLKVSTVAASSTFVSNFTAASSTIFNLSVRSSLSQLISTSSNLSLVGTSTMPNGPWKVLAQGANVFVSSFNDNTVSVIDANSRRIQATIPVGNGPSGMALSASLLFVVNSASDTVNILSITNTGTPIVVSTTSVGTSPYAVTTHGHYAYISNYLSDSVSIMDFTDPASPRIAATIPLDLGARPRGLSIQDNHLYVAESGLNLLTVYDISRPSAPVLENSISTSNTPYDVIVQDRAVYVASYGADKLDVFSMRISPGLGLVRSVSLPAGHPFSMTLSGRYLYIAQDDGNSLAIYDVALAYSPTLVTTIPAGTNVYSSAPLAKALVIASHGDNLLSFYSIAITSVNQLTAAAISAGQVYSNGDVSAQRSVIAGKDVSVGSGGIFSLGSITAPLASFLSGVIGTLVSYAASVGSLTATSSASLASTTLNGSTLAGNITATSTVNVFGTTTLATTTAGSLTAGSLNAQAVTSGALFLSSSTTPTTTTNALYRVGGQLFWNGSILGSGSGAGSSTASGSLGAIQFSNGSGGFLADSFLSFDTQNKILSNRATTSLATTSISSLTMGTFLANSGTIATATISTSSILFASLTNGSSRNFDAGIFTSASATLATSTITSANIFTALVQGLNATSFTAASATLATTTVLSLKINNLSGILHAVSGAISSSLISLTNDVAGVLSVANGGTGTTTLSGILLGNGTSSISSLSTSAGLLGAISDATGTGALVFNTNPTFNGASVNGSLTVANSATLNSLVVNGIATSTFAGGINLTSGCVSINGTCLSLSGSSGSNFATSTPYSAALRRTTAQSVAANSIAKITFDTKDFDNGAIASTALSKITIPANGVYVVSAAGGFVTSSNNSCIFIYKNSLAAAQNCDGTTAAQQRVLSLTRVMAFAAGDVLEMYLQNQDIAARTTGTTTPEQPVLSITNTNAANTVGAWSNGGNVFGVPATIGTADANLFSLMASGTARLNILTNGKIIIGTSTSLVNTATGDVTVALSPCSLSAGFELQNASGTRRMFCINGSDLSLVNQNTGTFIGSWNSSTGVYSAISDARLKHDIQDATSSLEMLRALPARTFLFNTDVTKTPVIGFIAQEIAAVFPEAVTQTDDGTSTLESDKAPWSIDYNQLTALAIKSIQEIASISSNFRASLVAWFANSTNGITDIFAKKIHVQEVCVQNEAGSEVCVTGDQLQAALGGTVSAHVENPLEATTSTLIASTSAPVIEQKDTVMPSEPTATSTVSN